MEISFEKGKFVYCPGGFNFFNHAKIIGTENIVYIGSANFSNESKQNIETGVIIEDSAFIARLYDEFFEYIKGNSTPYFDDDFNLLRLLTLNLIAKFTVHRAKLSDTLFQRTAYGTYYLPDSPDNVYFSGEDLAELDIFIRGIDSIIEVLKLVEELIDRYKDTRISADVDNT